MLCPYCLQAVHAFAPLDDGRAALRCPTCGSEDVPLMYPNDYDTHPAVPVAIIGNQAHGKTVYIDALVTHLEERGLGPNSSFGFVDEDGMRRYRQRLRELREQNLLPLASRAIFPTPEVTRLSGADLVGGCQLIFYDTGGESFETVDALRDAGKYVRHCRTVVWIVSLTNFEYAGEWTDRMTVYTQGLAAMGSRAADQTLVVALTKGDLLLDRRDLPEPARQFLADDGLDGPDAFARLDELSAALAGWLAAGPHRNTVNLLRNRFRAVRYCVLSALGSAPGEEGLVVGVAPRGVVAPLYWVLHETLPAVTVESGGTPRTALNLRTAVDAAPAGATIRLGPHNYELSGPLHLRKPVHLIGDPSGRSVIRGGTDKYLVAAASAGTVRLSRLTLERTGTASGDVVRVRRGTVVLTTCTVRGGVAGPADAPGLGVTAFGPDGATLELVDCTVGGNAADGVRVTNTAKLVARGCTLRGNGRHGLDAGGAEATLDGCTLTDNHRAGAILRSGVAAVRGCILTDNRRAGAVVDGARGELSGNTCERNGAAGISVRNESAAEVVANTCAGNAGDGIAVGGRAAGRVAENRCSANTGDGIAVADEATVEVTGNICSENRGDGIRYAGGAGGRAAGNTCDRNGRDGLSVDDAAAPALDGNTATANARSGYRVRSVGATTFARTNAATGNSGGDFDPQTLVRRGWWS